MCASLTFTFYLFRILFILSCCFTRLFNYCFTLLCVLYFAFCFSFYFCDLFFPFLRSYFFTRSPFYFLALLFICYFCCRSLTISSFYNCLQALLALLLVGSYVLAQLIFVLSPSGFCNVQLDFTFGRVLFCTFCRLI